MTRVAAEAPVGRVEVPAQPNACRGRADGLGVARTPAIRFGTAVVTPVASTRGRMRVTAAVASLAASH